MKKLDRHTLETAIKFVEDGHFLHDDAPAARMARECAAAMRKQLMPDSVATPLPDPEKVESLWNVGQVRQFIDSLDDTTSIRAQVVGQQGGAWNMCVGVSVLQSGDVHLRMYHPDLSTLPEFDVPARQMYKLKGSDSELRWYVETINPGGVHLKTPMGADTHINLPTFMKLYVEA